MMSEMKTAVCRLCFSTVLEGFDYMNLIQQDMVEIILPEMDLGICTNPVICKECDDVLKEFFKYKSFCLEIEDSIHNYISDGQLQVDLEKISGMDEMDNANGSKMCRTCLEIIESDSCIHLNWEENNLVRIMVQKCLKELDIQLTKEPVICEKCKNVLKKLDNFINLSMENEAKILNYLEHYQEKQVDLFNVQILFPEGTFGNKNKKYDTQSQPMKNLSIVQSEKDPQTSDFLEHSHSDTAQKNKCTDGCRNVIAFLSEVKKFESIINGTSTCTNENENILINENNVSSQLINNGGFSSQENIESSLKDSSNEIKLVTERTITEEILLISDDEEDTIVVDKEIASENGHRKHNKRTCTFNKGKSVTHIQDDHMTDSDDSSNSPVIKTDKVNNTLPEKYSIINNSRCIIDIEDDDQEPLENDTSSKSPNCKTDKDVEEKEVYVERKGKQMPESNDNKLRNLSERHTFNAIFCKYCGFKANTLKLLSSHVCQLNTALLKTLKDTEHMTMHVLKPFERSNDTTNIYESKNKEQYNSSTPLKKMESGTRELFQNQHVFLNSAEAIDTKMKFKLTDDHSVSQIIGLGINSPMQVNSEIDYDMTEKPNHTILAQTNKGSSVEMNVGTSNPIGMVFRKRKLKVHSNISISLNCSTNDNLTKKHLRNTPYSPTKKYSTNELSNKQPTLIKPLTSANKSGVKNKFSKCTGISNSKETLLQKVNLNCELVGSKEERLMLKNNPKELRILRCNWCPFNCRSVFKVEAHVLTHMTKFIVDNMLICPYCSNKFESLLDLYGHIKIMHCNCNYKVYYWCVNCATVFNKKILWDCHNRHCINKNKAIQLFRSNGVIFCLFCTFESSDEKEAKDHSRICQKKVDDAIQID